MLDIRKNQKKKLYLTTESVILYFCLIVWLYLETSKSLFVVFSSLFLVLFTFYRIESFISLSVYFCFLKLNFLTFLHSSLCPIVCLCFYFFRRADKKMIERTFGKITHVSTPSYPILGLRLNYFDFDTIISWGAKKSKYFCFQTKTNNQNAN